MLIKPIVDQLKSQDFFTEIRASKNIPMLDDLTKSSITLPICYLLPVKDSGASISSDHRPTQSVTSTYSFCIITNAGDLNTVDEPPMTLAKQKLIEALLGFSISSLYHPAEFVSSQIQETNKQYESWVMGFQAARNFKKII